MGKVLQLRLSVQLKLANHEYKQLFKYIKPMNKNNASISEYFRIARFDNSIKHIFAVPGIVLALQLRGVTSSSLLLNVLLGLVTLVCIASANYVINEYLDRNFDKHHPEKYKRPAVQVAFKWQYIWLEWALFIVIGLIAAYMSSASMFITAVIFALQGIIYNVPPIRMKDLPYLDVISESINNPIRLVIGWLMIDPGALPPISIILSYFFGGAFLMAAKRLSEYREIVASHGKELLVKYRTSFKWYGEVKLTVSSFVYAMLSLFFLAVFLVKYRIEYLILIPWIILLFGYYLALAMKHGETSTERPEKLYKERVIVLMVLVLVVVFFVTTLVDIPYLDQFLKQKFILMP